MWKIILGFVVFAAVAMFVIIKGGDKLDMAGEQHGAGADHTPAATSPATSPASAASGVMPPASAASQ